MSLVLKNKKKNPHLALTHNELQNGSANGRNISLLMKSDVEITEDIAELIEKVSGVKVEVTKASYETLRTALDEAIRKFRSDPHGYSWVIDFDEDVVVFSSDSGMFYATYKLENGEVEVGNEAIEVSRVVSYKEEGDKIVLSDNFDDIDDGVRSLIVKSFDSISKNEKLVDIFKSKLGKGKKMEEIQKAVDAATQVLKADLDKAQTDLKEALGQVEAFQKSAQEQKESLRKTAITEVVKDAEKVEELLKATSALDEDSFQVVLKSFKDKIEQMEGSDLFDKKSQKTDITKADEVPGHVQMLRKQFDIKE